MEDAEVGTVAVPVFCGSQDQSMPGALALEALGLEFAKFNSHLKALPIADDQTVDRSYSANHERLYIPEQLVHGPSSVLHRHIHLELLDVPGCDDEVRACAER